MNEATKWSSMSLLDICVVFLVMFVLGHTKKDFVVELSKTFQQKTAY